MIQASSRHALQYAMAALIAVVGSAVLLKGAAMPQRSLDATAGAGLPSYVGASLLALAGLVLVVMAVAELVRPRRPLGRARESARHRR